MTQEQLPQLNLRTDRSGLLGKVKIAPEIVVTAEQHSSADASVADFDGERRSPIFSFIGDAIPTDSTHQLHLKLMHAVTMTKPIETTHVEQALPS